MFRLPAWPLDVWGVIGHNLPDEAEVKKITPNPIAGETRTEGGWLMVGKIIERIMALRSAAEGGTREPKELEFTTTAGQSTRTGNLSSLMAQPIAAPISGPEARLVELARQTAERNHYHNARYGEPVDVLGVHTFDQRAADYGFRTCPHPDCVLVRELAGVLVREAGKP